MRGMIGLALAGAVLWCASMVAAFDLGVVAADHRPGVRCEATR